MAKMGTKWSDFPIAIREGFVGNLERIQPEINSLDISILCWSFGALEFPLDQFSNANLNPLFTATMRALPSINSQELSSLIWGLSGTNINWDSFPPQLKWSLNVALRRVGPVMSPQDVANCAYGLTLLSFDTQFPLDPGFILFNFNFNLNSLFTFNNIFIL